jgi:uncharacterized protein (UPF0335 family)
MKEHLRSIIDRVERLSEERKALSDDIRGIYAEAKSDGYDVRALREIIRLRKLDSSERQEREAIIETYMVALGMLADLPLGQAALARVA